MKQHLILSFLLSFSLLSLGQNIPSYVPTNGLVAWYPFNGNANDESGNGNNGSVSGATLTSDRLGNANKAYIFDGVDDYINVPFSASFNSIQTGLTMSAWILMDGGTGASTPPRVMELRGAYGNGGDAGFVMLAQDNSNVSRTFEVRWHNDNGNTNISIAPTTSVSSLVWHHLIYTANGNSAYGAFYVDGVLVNTNASMSSQGTILSCNYNNNPLIIGAESNLLGKWGGKIDDIGIWNRSLSQQEITNLYNTSLPAACPSLPSNLQTGLVGYWPFCGNANDASGNGNHGTVNGATLTTDRFGDSAKAYSFDGNDDYIQVNNSNTLQPVVFTISSWVFGTNYDGFRQVVSKNLGTLNNESINFFINKLSTWNLSAQVGGNGFYGTLLKSPILFNENEWHHISYSYNGISSIQSLYIDGNKVASNIALSSIQYDSQPLTIGAQIENGLIDYFFAGKLDDICIWSRVLDSTEITQLYQTQSSNASLGNVGINVTAPQRSLHIKDVIRLEPRDTAPDNPVRGDMYYDGTLNKLRVYDGTTWQNCW